MSISAISAPIPATAPASASALTPSKAAAPSKSAAPAGDSATSSAAAKVALSTVAQEAKESPAQTLKEAAGGDRQAQKLLHHGTAGTVVNTKA